MINEYSLQNTNVDRIFDYDIGSESNLKKKHFY